jgi:hypothetical protein
MVAIEMMMTPDIYFQANLSYMVQKRAIHGYPLLHTVSLAFNRSLASTW